MIGDRDVLNVSKPTNLRTSPSAFRKCAKGCCPSKIPASKGSVFSSSVSKGQSMYSGRRGTSAISETLLLAADGERKRVVGGKTTTKRSAVLTVTTPNIVVEDGAKDDQLDAPLKPNTPEAEMEKSKGCALSDDAFYEHVPDLLQQPSCSEKVSKWLEESQHSTMTDLSDNHIVFPEGDPEINEREENREVVEREIVGKETKISDAEDLDNMIRRADNEAGTIRTAQSSVKFAVDKRKGHSRLSRARRIVIGYLKVLMCLSVVYLGFLLRIRPVSGDNYEPPPT